MTAKKSASEELKVKRPATRAGRSNRVEAEDPLETTQDVGGNGQTVKQIDANFNLMGLWDSLQETDPDYTRPFNNGRFSGTVINPQWRYRRLTEAFGPAGVGWGDHESTISWKTLGDGDTLVTATTRLWYMLDGEQFITPPGIAIQIVQFEGKRPDEDAAKKAFTDALTNAAKYIGLGADVYLGLYDDTAYVEDIIERRDRKRSEAAQSPESESEVVDSRSDEKPARGRSQPLEEKAEPAEEIPFPELDDWTLTANAFCEFVSPDMPLTELIGYWQLNSTVLSEVAKRDEESLRRITDRISEWVFSSLVGGELPDSTAKLTAVWRKHAKVVNGLKNTEPRLSQAIKDGFRDVEDDILDQEEER